MFDTVISIVMLAAIALLAGAVALLRRGRRKQAGLMAILSIIMIVNVAIWLVPNADGDTLADAAVQPGD